MMTKQSLITLDFQPDYQEYQQLISQLSRKPNLPKTSITIQKLQHQLQLILQQISDNSLSPPTSQIFTRYSTVQQLSHKKKTASDCCFSCGQQIKKQVQCEICAEVFCKNCCWRKRVIPNEGKASQFRLACEECHEAYVKYFNHRDFFKQKACYLKAIKELQKKYQKSQIKFNTKQTQLNQYKKEKQLLKFKEAQLKKQLMNEQKRVQMLKETFSRVAQEKEKQRQQQQKTKQALQKQKIKQSSQQQNSPQNPNQPHPQKPLFNPLLQPPPIPQQNTLPPNPQPSNPHHSEPQQPQAQTKQQLQWKQRMFQKDQLNFDDILRESQRVDEEINMDQILETKQGHMTEIMRARSGVSWTQIERQNTVGLKPNHAIVQTPKEQKALNPIVQKQQQKQATLMHSPKQQAQIAQSALSSNSLDVLLLEGPPQQASPTQTPIKRLHTSSRTSQHSQQPSILPPSVTMAQLKTMNINTLLSMKIPMNPSQPKNVRKSIRNVAELEGSQTSTATEQDEGLIAMPNQVMVAYVGGGEEEKEDEVRTQEVFTQSFREEDARDSRLTKNDILKRSSLISSNQTNKTTIVAQRQPEYDEDLEPEPQKCSCEIM